MKKKITYVRPVITAKKAGTVVVMGKKAGCSGSSSHLTETE